MTDPAEPELSLHGLALGGDAVARQEGRVVFVPYGAPGDRVRTARWEARKNFAKAWISSIVEPAPERVAAPCPYFFKPGAAPETVCGGCDWQQLDYAAQARAKRQLLIEAFQRVGRIAKPPVEETLAAESPWRYRNKAQIPFAPAGGPDNPAGGLKAGFYAPASHNIVPFDDCLVQPEPAVALFRSVKEWFARHPAAAYDQSTEQGWLRHLLIRVGAGGNLLAALVTKDEGFPNAVAFAEYLSAANPGLRSLFQNVNPKPGSVVLGPQWRHLWGKRYLEETLLGLRFRLSPGTFFQVNREMAEKLYQKVAEFADLKLEDHALELYAGVGAIAQLLARKAKYVWAVEDNAQAVEDAIESAKENGVSNVRFYQGRCEDVLTRGRFSRGVDDVLGAVVLDPPRAGCEQSVLKAVMRLAPAKIVYVSCDPATLARDARYLSTGGYLLRRSVPVDLFPQTAHVESVSLFMPSGAPLSVPPPAPRPPQKNFRPGARDKNRPWRALRKK
ncbi:MAG: 23S rRNA (uracil(1939)-C(5))-methyltransferase RlmD [Elusimicrobiota bacterium]